MDLELRELRYFITTAKLGTLTRAADALYVSQPTLTRAIQKLEQTVGGPLFEREKNQMIITDMGRELYTRAQLLLRDYESMIRGIGDVKDLGVGYVSIGLPPCTIPLLFHNTFLEFKKAHPNVALYFYDSGAETVIKSLLQGDLDLGIIVQESPHEDIEEIPLFYGQMVAAIHEEHPLASCEALDFSQLRGEPLCILQKGYIIERQAVNKCRENGFEPIISCTNVNCDFLIKMARAQREIALVPYPIFMEEPYEGMVAVPFREPWPWTICLAWRKEIYLSYSARALKEMIFSRFL